MFKVELLSQAEDELSEAYEWYDEQIAGLGNEFYREVSHYLNLIEANPYHFPVKYIEELRSASLKGFHFSLFTGSMK